ncbi:MAG TPA: AMP-binding protein [Rhizomicrobium sp.]|jgi:malonyl-CoA/methylmalonyl-CoA synthetase|nr:AMP-binding protein [Rhizomicrobium sp.]
MDESLFAQMRTAMPEGNRPFLRTADGRHFSYDDMLMRSAQFANSLHAAGVRPGDRLAVQVEKSAEALLLYLACLRAGAIYVPLNPAYTPAETSWFLADSEPICFVAAPEKAETIQTLLGDPTALLTLGDDGRAGSLTECAGSVASGFDDAMRAGDDVAAILYTSGTTGRPKGAMLTQRNLASNALVLRDLWQFSRSDVLLHALPLYHTHGLFTATNTSMMAGASMILLPRFDLDRILAHLPEATTMMGVPTFYTRLLADSRLDRARVAHMRLFISGSAPLLPETHRAWLDRTGHAILERYGMTETGMIASNPCDGERIAGTVGLPLPGVELRVADPQEGSPLPSGQVGMIELRGPNVFKSYWRKPDGTAAAFREDGFFVTGDLGTIDSSGYLRIAGRVTDLVISGGFNVYPREIETEIDALTGVAESAVIGLPHPDIGEGVTAIVVLRDGAALGEADLLSALGSALPDTNCQGACCSPVSSHAMPWEKYRRTFCARATAISIGGDEERETCHD